MKHSKFVKFSPIDKSEKMELISTEKILKVETKGDGLKIYYKEGTIMTPGHAYMPRVITVEVFGKAESLTKAIKESTREIVDYTITGGLL